MEDDGKSEERKQAVLSFIDALNREDFDSARKLVNENLSFIGPLGTRDGADVYVKDMERLRLKYDVKKTFVESKDVCLIYDITFNKDHGAVYSCGMYHLEGGKISSIRVVFDPRPLLEPKK
jgi:hypothetical protein